MSSSLGNLLKEKLLSLKEKFTRIHEHLSLLFSGSMLLLITLILPYSGDGEEVQVGWSDQRLFLASLKRSTFVVNHLFMSQRV
jgi:hypothetical protein